MSTSDQLRELAIEIEAGDAATAEQLRSLASALDPDGSPGGWIGVAPKDVIDIELIVTSVETGDGPAGRAAVAEVVRNVLILVPIILTWAGLFYAAMGYQQIVANHPELATEPFLLLWEQQFRGLLEPPLAYFSFLRLSVVAFVDVTVLIIVGILTAYIQHEVSMSQHARDVRARSLGRRLSQTVGAAHLELAERATVPALIDSFKRTAEDLVAELKAERVHLVAMADERERLLADLRLVTRDLRAGAGELVRSAADYSTVAAQLDMSVTALGAGTDSLVASNGNLTAAMQVHLDELKHDHELAAGNAAQLGQLATSMVTTLESVLPAVAGLSAATREVRAAADSVLRAVEDEGAARHTADETMRVATAALAAAVQDARDAASAGALATREVAKATDELRAASKAMTISATAGASANSDAAQALVRAIEQMSAATNTLSKSLEESTAASSASAQMLRSAADEVSRAARTVTSAVAPLERAVRDTEGRR